MPSDQNLKYLPLFCYSPNIELALQQPSPALPWLAAHRVMLRRFWNVQKFRSLPPWRSSIATYWREPLRDLVFVVKISCKHCKNLWTSSGRCKVPHGHLGRWGCLRCGNAERVILQDGAEVTVEQSRMFDIPVTWHIKHSQITVSPNSQMCERGFIWASPYRCHSLCFSRVNPR